MRLLCILTAILMMVPAENGKEWTKYRPEAKQAESADETFQRAGEYYANGNLYAAKAFYIETISRVVKDSTRSEIDYESRISMAQIEAQSGNLESARRWLHSINTRAVNHSWAVYPEGWRQELAKENQKISQMIGDRELREKKIKTAYICTSITAVLLMLLFLYLFITKVKAYKKLVKQAEKWAHSTSISTNDPEEEIRQIARKITEYVSESQCYLTPGLKMDDIVTALGSNRTYVSKAVNSMASNFNALINEYRVKESVKLITTDRNISLDDVAFQCGFNSRKAFNAAFKNFTGLTPANFKRSKILY